MATEDRRRDFWKMFVRPKHAPKESKVKPVNVPGVEGRITDALGASRAMRPTVLLPATTNGSSGPQLTVLRPPTSGGTTLREPGVSVDAARRLRLSLSFTTVGTLIVALGLLLMVSFIIGTRYEYSRSHSAAAVPQGGTPVVRASDRHPTPVPPVRLGGGDGGTPAPADTTKWRLRIGVYPVTERDKAEKAVAALRQAGVPASIEPRRISGRDQLAIYSEKDFASRSSAEADALQQKVRMIKADGRYEFATAYFVTAD